MLKSIRTTVFILLCFLTSFIFSIIIYADVATELNSSTIIVDKGLDSTGQIIDSVDISSFISPVPLSASLLEFTYYSLDSSIATVSVNYVSGEITVTGVDYGRTTIIISNDNCTEYVEVNVVYPRSGSEPTYIQSEWVSSSVRNNRHCYCYALDLGRDVPFPLNSISGSLSQFNPGNIAEIFRDEGLYSMNVDLWFDLNASTIIYNTKHDIRALCGLNDTTEVLRCLDISEKYAEDFTGYSIVENGYIKPCSEGYYKVVLVLSGGDYHWYRQDSNGLWTHKMGKDYVSSLDTNGEYIVDPRTCAKSFGVDSNGDGEFDSYKQYEYVGCFEIKKWKKQE